MKKLVSVVLGSALVFSSCTKKAAEAPAPEAKVQNTFTDYVDRGVTTMHKAETAAATSEAKNAELEQQSKAVEGL